jgi:integration host factor subunit beta
MALVNLIPAGDNMKKSELIDDLGAETGLSKKKAEEVVELFFAEISKALGSGNRVEIRGFCSFFVKHYKCYTGRNPKTGKLIIVPQKKLPFFKCGKELKERVDYPSNNLREEVRRG